MVAHEVGRAGPLHARDLVPPVRRRVEVFEVEAPALVLGSTQPEGHADRPGLVAAGVDLVRRRSGGGAVLLEPGGSTWVDVIVPAGDPLWDGDVGRSAHWVGRAWARGLADLGVAATVHTGGLVASPWSPWICFAGLGPGELVAAGRKLVGISQRRSRAGARFQCVLHRRWDPQGILSLLALEHGDRSRAAVELTGVAAGVDRPPSEVVDALVAHLPPPPG
ncbi:MAG TPA: hypothetical protein VNT56_06195 [Acidimicrobiales bacterium]|nr:hypothetical protein [Acidimicrobiales bacterium]